jgi:oligo-1,6-glucosidase
MPLSPPPHRLFLENHDHARSVSRYANDTPEWRTAAVTLLALFHTTKAGTVFVYQGQELGMANFGRTWGLEEYKDVATINFWNVCVFLSLFFQRLVFLWSFFYLF